MPRIALGIQYEGTDYYGWQSQVGLPTVQQAVESALTKVADQPVSVVCAGRTDRGVHALGQVVHFDAPVSRDLIAWQRGGNCFLPRDVSITWARSVPDSFHARFSATARQYRYILYNHESRPGMMHRYVKWECRALNIDRMREAANHLIGEHDFSSFRGSGCQAKTAIRTMTLVRIEREGCLWTIDVRANAFLLHMVRNIVGSLLRVGAGLETAAWMRQVLEGKNRCLAGMTASPAGLLLTNVCYDDIYGLPAAGIEVPRWPPEVL